MNNMIRGAYIDKKRIKWDTNNPNHKGWLIKRSAWMHGWRRRYFILKGSKLFFSKDEYVAPHGMIDLVDCIEIKDVSANNREYVFEIRLVDETFLLQAISVEEKSTWVDQLNQAIIKHSSIMTDN